MSMKRKTCVMIMAVTVVLSSVAFGAPGESLGENQCVTCHGTEDVWEEDTRHLYVTAEDLASDIHWQEGFRCQDCHGGNPDTLDLRGAHATEDGFRKIESPADIPGFCGHCHSDREVMLRYQDSFETDPVAEFWSGVHGKHLQEMGGPEAATCTSCHPEHRMRPVDDSRSDVHPKHLVQTCGACHQDQRTAMRKGVHHAAGRKRADGSGMPLACSQCHGENAHAMLPVDHSQSPVFLDNQVDVCGGCHEEPLATYEASVHGHGLRESGLLVTAVCADCHGAHDSYYAADTRSRLHPTNVAHTCGECHHYIEERLKTSVHGRGDGPGIVSRRETSDGEAKRKPSCVDCHQGHDQPHPEKTQFRVQLPNRCGNCHAEISQQYTASLHGELTQLGYGPAAKCSDCHGAHTILAAGNPQSRLAVGKRVDTCRTCHPYAVANFAEFDPHANPKNRTQYAGLYQLLAGTEFVVYVLFGLFVVHAFLWFTRSLVHTFVYGRQRGLSGEQWAIVRFSPMLRVCYFVFTVSFVALALTGLPLKYSRNQWASELAEGLGGFEATSTWHHFFAVLVLVTSVGCVVSVAAKLIQLRRRNATWRSLLFGPDSLVPNGRDVRDLWGMSRWFFGLGRKPRFERWTYWEKLDVWALVLTVGIIGGSGLMLWYPNLCCLVVSGSALNVAKVLHSRIALLAASFIFIIHVFHWHLRPEKFPMDVSLWTGLAGARALRRSRTDYVERLREEGQLSSLLVAVPSMRTFWPVIAIGACILVLGLLLLGCILLVSLAN
ncbi:MAG: cytochrome c3 family protein [Planctomycetota bacterium]